jgi:hypothetical protein
MSAFIWFPFLDKTLAISQQETSGPQRSFHLRSYSYTLYFFTIPERILGEKLCLTESALSLRNAVTDKGRLVLQTHTVSRPIFAASIVSIRH